MVSVLVLLPWDLNKFCLKVVYLVLHLPQVVLHLFALAFIVAVNLAGGYLRITIYEHIGDSCCFGEIQPCYQGFVLCLVIGHWEIESDHVFDLVPFWIIEYHSSSACLFVGRFIRVDTSPWTLFCPLSFYVGEFCDEVGNNLSFNGRARVILYVEFA